MDTPLENINFFRNELRVPQRTLQEMVLVHDIQTAADLANWDDEMLKQLKEDLRKPSGTEATNNPNIVIPKQPFLLSAVSYQRLSIACSLIRYYNAVGRVITPDNLMWNGPMEQFGEYLKGLKAAKDEETPDVPRITQKLPIMKWTEAFENHLLIVLGAREIPLAYVIRAEADPGDPDELVRGQPYGATAGSITQELVTRATHDHPLFRSDNQTVFNLLDDVLRTTSYAPTLSVYRRTKNGRGAWLAILAQYVGKDKWISEAKQHSSFFETFVWKGNNNVSLDDLASKYRMRYQSLKRCQSHVKSVTVPSEPALIEKFLDAIQCADPRLQAAMANVRADDSDGGKMENFESMIAYVLPHDPVKNKRKGNNSVLVGAVHPDLGVARGPKTGVDVRFYTKAEYRTLSNEQKKELKEIREQNKKRDNDKKGGNPNKRQKVDASVRKKQVEGIIAAICRDADKSIDDKKEIKEGSLASVVVKAIQTMDPAKQGVAFEKLQSIQRGGKSSKSGKQDA